MMRRLALWAVLGAAATPWTVAAQDARGSFGPHLKKGARIAILGDSITEQRLYSANIASYLAACHPDLEAHVFQFGWSGETAGGCLARLENDILITEEGNLDLMADIPIEAEEIEELMAAGERRA